MIKYYLVGHEYEYEARGIYRIFDMNSEIQVYFDDCENIDLEDDVLTIQTKLFKDEEGTTAIARLYNGFKLACEKTENTSKIKIEKHDIKKLYKTVIRKTIYDALSEYFGVKAEYGYLTGIRPNKILSIGFENGLTWEEIRTILSETYEVKDNKIELLYNVYKMQEKYINHDINNKNYNLYIGIPFCPTKCVYCSFVSFTKYNKELVDNYVKALLFDVEETIKLAIKKDLKLNTIYIGGGTPSVLSCDNINDIFKVIKKYYDINTINEISFEAGRPDTIDYDLLKCLRDNGVDRISINPQTMNDETLKRISRKHTVQDIINVYNLAKQFNFNSINMDLIIGLPGENELDVKNSIEKVIELNPDNITVHALAYKKGSKLTDSTKNLSKDYNIMEKMFYLTKYACLNSHYSPYYMYRQKNIKGNLENIGYCVEGKESIYNIVIIEEIETILACGAGAVSKILKGNNRHERVQNYRNLEDYVSNVIKNINEKDAILMS